MSDSGIFKAAVKLSPERRAAYLDQVCRTNHELRREVESLLRRTKTPAVFCRARPPDRRRPSITERPGSILGPYKLLQMTVLGRVLHARGDYAAAEPLLVKNLEVRRRVSGAELLHIATAMGHVAELYLNKGKYDQSELLAAQALPIHRRVLGEEHPGPLWLMYLLAEAYLRQGKYDQAEPVVRECLAIREKKMPDDSRTFSARSQLGAALAGQKKYAEAEPLLVPGYEGLKQRTDMIPAASKARSTDALERLVQLYEATGQPDEAAKWRKEREARKAVEKKP